MTRVVVLGAGMSGICTAIKLLQDGVTDVTLLEKGQDVGGTWRDNTYPGIACDVASRHYAYSFAPNPRWSRWFPPGEEVHAYFRDVAQRHGVLERTRLGTEAVAAAWDEDRALWEVRTSAGDVLEAEVLVSATGVLHHPRLPDVPGLGDFAGPAFHSARWDHDVPLAGRRVGVIGTGSTATQITAALGGVASRLTVFQRTAQWVYPLPNPRVTRPTRALHERFPGLSKIAYRGWERAYELTFVAATMRDGVARKAMSAACRLHLRTVRDPELRRKLTPADQPMCRRLVIGTGFYRALQRPDVDLVTDRIERVEAAGVRTADGTLHELDVLVLATGFDAHAFVRPMRLVGRGGRTLDDVWAPAPHAYRTVGVPGMPNLLMLMGPHSPIGNVSLTAIAETQADYVVRFVRAVREGRIRAAAPREDVTAQYNAQLRAALPGTVWTTGCASWYRDANGEVALWPWSPAHHREMLAEPRLEEFETV
jgi:cation diffusion facilitator CzcD-associated flavoprotein CzcO